MKTIYLIVSIIVIVFFFMLIGKSEDPGTQQDTTRSEITNYVPDVMRDSTSLQNPLSTDTTQQANTENLETRSEVQEGENNIAQARLDTLQHIRESLSDSYKRPVNQGSEISQKSSDQVSELSQKERKRALLEIKQLLKNNQ